MFEVKSMDEFTEKVVDSNYPVVVMFYEKGHYQSEKLKNLLRKYMAKSHGKFFIAFLDYKESQKITGNAL